MLSSVHSTAAVSGSGAASGNSSSKRAIKFIFLTTSSSAVIASRGGGRTTQNVDGRVTAAAIPQNAAENLLNVSERLETKAATRKRSVANVRLNP
jgi:hypothetical protein